MSTDTSISCLSIAVIAWFSASMEQPFEQMKHVSLGIYASPDVSDLAKYTRILELIMSCVM